MMKLSVSKLKLSSSLLLTLILLSLMLAVGVIAATWGYVFGRNALKGTTQPVINPILGSPGSGTAADGDVFLRESDIIASVKAQIQGITKPDKDPKETKQQPEKKTGKSERQKSESVMLSQDQGVSLEVKSLERQSEQLVLNVSLKNDSDRSVQFLYTFLEVIDDQGRPLTAITEGLPTDLQPKGQAFSGKIAIPKASLEEAKQISIKLTNYPNQDLNLQITNIPVAEKTNLEERT